MRDPANLAHFLEGLAVVAAALGRAETAAMHFGAAEGLLEDAGGRLYNYYAPDRSLYEHTAADLRSRLGDPAFDEALTEGRQMIFEQAVALALDEAHRDDNPTPP